MSPVDPALASTYEEPSLSTPQRRLCHRASKSSVIGTGGLIVRLVEIPKNPTTRSPSAVVVTDGATKDKRSGVKAPLCESTGIETSAPLTSRIAPAIETDESSDHVYCAGSDAPATL
jgi:hypothetical protein